jgi:hypothetical protein
MDPKDGTAQEKARKDREEKISTMRKITSKLMLSPTLDPVEESKICEEFGLLSLRKINWLGSKDIHFFSITVDHFDQVRSMGIDPQRVYQNFFLGTAFEFNDGERIIFTDGLEDKPSFEGFREVANNYGYKLSDTLENES